MDRRTLTAAIFASALALVSNPAFASSDQDAVNSCRAALSVEAEAETKFRFKSLKGSSKKTVTFTASNGDYRERVTCVVRRGAVIDIAYADNASRFARN